MLIGSDGADTGAKVGDGADESDTVAEVVDEVDGEGFGEEELGTEAELGTGTFSGECCSSDCCC